MKLYGSITSPYVRRLRILLAGTEYVFENVNIFDETREQLKEVNPTLKIPMFEDLNNPELPLLLDSSLAFEYLQEKLSFPSLNWFQKNDLALIDSCNDSLVNIMILTRSKVDTKEDKMYFNIQRERQQATFDYFENKIKEGHFNEWNYASISLLVLIEWAMFRNLFDFSKFPYLKKFVDSNQDKIGVRETKPS